MRVLPPLVHVRAPGNKGRSSLPPSSATGAPSSDDHSARAVPVDVLRRELQGHVLPRDTEVLFSGLGDWTPAHAVPELWIAPAAVEASAAAMAEADLPPDSVELPKSSAVGSSKKRRGTSALGIFGAIGGAIALLGIGAAAIFFIYFYYKPVATQHLPGKCVIAARVDLIDWAFFDPFMTKIVPAIDEATHPPTAPVGPSGPSLKDRLKASAGIDLDRDVREIATCVYQDTSTPKPGAAADPLHGIRFVLAIGGKLHQGAIAGVYDAIRTESFAAGMRIEGSGDSAVIRVTSPIEGVIGQADDGTLLFAPDDAALEKARAQNTEDEALDNTGLAKQGALELVLNHVPFGFLDTFVAPTPTIDAETLDALGRIKSGHFTLELSKTPRIAANLEARNDTEAKGVETGVRRLRDVLLSLLAGTSVDHAGEHAAISGAQLTRTDAKVDVRVDFLYGDVDRGAAELADQIKSPTSQLRLRVLPTFLFSIGAGPPPPPLPSASGSTSASASASSSVPGSSSTAPSPPSTFPRE